MSRVRRGSTRAPPAARCSPRAPGEVSPDTAQRVRRAAERLGYVPNTLGPRVCAPRAPTSPPWSSPTSPTRCSRRSCAAPSRCSPAPGSRLVLTDTNNAEEIERSQIASHAGARRRRLHHGHRQLEGLAARRPGRRGLPDRPGQPSLRHLRASVRRCATTSRVSDSVSTTWPDSDTATSCTWPDRPTPRPAGNAPTPFARPCATAGCRCRNAVIECAALHRTGGGGRSRPSCWLVAGRSPRWSPPTTCSPSGVIDELARGGLQCPRDYSITGFNDLAFMDKLTPPLTTVRVPFTEMGAQAARGLLEWISRQSPPRHSRCCPSSSSCVAPRARSRLIEPVLESHCRRAGSLSGDREPERHRATRRLRFS